MVVCSLDKVNCGNLNKEIGLEFTANSSQDNLSLKTLCLLLAYSGCNVERSTVEKNGECSKFNPRAIEGTSDEGLNFFFFLFSQNSRGKGEQVVFTIISSI